jgi:lysophospholipase L1-like esterase
MKRVLLFTLLLLAAACRPAAEPLAPLPTDGVVLAFGDSLTFGTGAATGEGYPELLAGLIGRTVINAGVPGEVSAEGAARLPELLDRHRPALLVLCHGGNDLLRRLGEEQLRDNLRTMVGLARERGVGVLLVGVPSLGLTLTAPPLYREVAREFKIPYEGKALPTIEGDRALKADPIHPNAAGYRRLAEAVAAQLRTSGAL